MEADEGAVLDRGESRGDVFLQDRKLGLSGLGVLTILRGVLRIQFRQRLGDLAQPKLPVARVEPDVGIVAVMGVIVTFMAVVVVAVVVVILLAMSVIVMIPVVVPLVVMRLVIVVAVVMLFVMLLVTMLFVVMPLVAVVIMPMRVVVMPFLGVIIALVTLMPLVTVAMWLKGRPFAEGQNPRAGLLHQGQVARTARQRLQRIGQPWG